MGRKISLGIYPNTDSTLTGTLADRPTTANAGVKFFNTDSNQLEIFNGTGWHAVHEVLNASISSSQGGASNRQYWVDATGGPITASLPSSPAQYDRIKFTDAHNSFGSNALTVARNGQLISGQADDMTVDTPGASFTLIYHGVAAGWKIEAI